MRLLIFLFLFPLMAHAGPYNGKQPPLPSVVRIPKENGLPKWTVLDSATRHLIVKSWLQEDEMTRVPFPVFRDAWLRSSSLKDDSALKTRSSNGGGAPNMRGALKPRNDPVNGTKKMLPLK